ncbi:MAG: FAD-dependent monooxygenase [Solirubrobacteraceae bacterium]
MGTPEGYVLLAPLPDDRWITFVGDLHEDEVARLASDTSLAAVRATIERRITGEIRLDDVAWATPFQMHHRLVSRLAGKRRFLLGDAGHLSSPFGGEGLNSGLHDAHNLGWKLPLVLSLRGRACLLQSFASERLAADRHVLEVSDRLHALAHGAVQSAPTGERPAPPTPEQVAAVVRSRSMLDVSYAGSPLVGEYLGPGEEPARDLVPGDRYPDRIELTTSHRLLLFDADDVGVARLRKRWRGLIDVDQGTEDAIVDRVEFRAEHEKLLR